MMLYATQFSAYHKVTHGSDLEKPISQDAKLDLRPKM